MRQPVFAWRWSLRKSEIREWVRPLRRLITPLFREQASIAAADHFKKSPFFTLHQRFACYMAVTEEIDSLPLMQALWQAKKTCYLPVLSNATDKKLQFALYEEGMELVLNRYRILEPRSTFPLLAGSELDVVVLPLLAFDARGNRLGTGGGYYDRTFAFMLEEGKKQVQRPTLLGLAYSLQKVAALPREAFDVPLKGVITEEEISVF